MNKIDLKTLEERNFWYPQLRHHVTQEFTDYPTPSVNPTTTISSTDPIPQTGVAIKKDSGKTDWSLMPWESVEEINRVLEFGAQKYSAHNWKEGGGFSYTRVLNSLLRHIFSYIRGEDRDPESGLSHLAHAGCNVLFLLYYERYKEKYSNDDRIK